MLKRFVKIEFNAFCLLSVPSKLCVCVYLFRWDVQMNFMFPHMSKGPIGDDLHYGKGLRLERSELFPILSRSNNIGFENGIHANLFTPQEMMTLQYLYNNVATHHPTIEKSSIIATSVPGDDQNDDIEKSLLNIYQPLEEVPLMSNAFVEKTADEAFMKWLCLHCLDALYCGEDTIRSLKCH